MTSPDSPEQWARMWAEEQRLKSELEAARADLTQALRNAFKSEDNPDGASPEQLAQWTGAPISTVTWRIYGPTAEQRRKKNPIPQGKRVRRGSGPGLSVTMAAEAMGVSRPGLYKRMHAGSIPVLKTATGATRIPVDESGEMIAIPEEYVRSKDPKWPEMQLWIEPPVGAAPAR